MPELRSKSLNQEMFIEKVESSKKIRVVSLYTPSNIEPQCIKGNNARNAKRKFKMH